MLFKNKFVRTLVSGVVCAIVATITVGCDESYDFSKLGGDVTIFQNGISLPVESELAISLSELLTDSITGDFIKVDEKGRYTLYLSGAVDPVEFEVPAISFDGISPDLGSTHLDFAESILKDPVIGPLLESIGYTGGAVPDIEQLVVPEDVVHAVIPAATETFEFVVTDIPQEIVSISEVKLDGAIATLSLHAEGFPADIDSIEFEFLLDPPHELYIKPLDEKIYYSEVDHYYHIVYKLPCINGCLDDQVQFEASGIGVFPPWYPDDFHRLSENLQLRYAGFVHIKESFHLGGWVPQFDLNIGFSLSSAVIEEVSGEVQATIDPISLTQELTGLPDFLIDSKTKLDLQEVSFELNVNNNIPLGVHADFEIESKFFDGSSSGVIASPEPLVVEPLSQQHLLVTNVEQPADADVDVLLVPGLEKLIDKIPQTFAFTVEPYVPATELTLRLGQSYSVDLDYSLNVPVVFGKGMKMSYETSLGDITNDLRNVSTYISHAQVSGVFESTLPLNLNLILYAVDKNGNIMEEIKMSNALEVTGNKTSPFNIGLQIVPEQATFEKLDRIMLSVSGDASDAGELSPEQFLKIRNLVLSLPEGVTVLEDISNL